MAIVQQLQEKLDARRQEVRRRFEKFEVASQQVAPPPEAPAKPDLTYTPRSSQESTPMLLGQQGKAVSRPMSKEGGIKEEGGKGEDSGEGEASLLSAAWVIADTLEERRAEIEGREL